MSLAAGRYTIVIGQADDVGNVGATAARRFSVVENALTVRLDAPADGAATNARRPVFAGGVAGAGSGPVTVHLRAADAAAGAADLQTLSAPVDMTAPDSLHPFTVTAASDLPEGTYAASADWSGPGGAAGSSGITTFGVDLTPPAVALTTPADGMATAQDPIEVSGTGEPDRQVAVTATGPGGTSVVREPYATPAGTWSTALHSLPDGAYVIAVRQTDAAGNATDAPPRTTHVDRTAPAPVILAPQDGGDLTAGTVTLRGATGGVSSDADTVQLPPPPAPGATPPRSTPTARTIADALLPGRGSVSLGGADALGNRLFLVPSSRLRLRRAATQTRGRRRLPAHVHGAHPRVDRAEGGPRPGDPYARDHRPRRRERPPAHDPDRCGAAPPHPARPRRDRDAHDPHHRRDRRRPSRHREAAPAARLSGAR